MKVLVTGAAGYLGSVITETLLNNDFEVIGLDNLSFNQISLLPFASRPNFRFVYGDVQDKKLLKTLVDESDIIIPLAAIVGFPACDANPKLAEEINFGQVKNIVDWIQGTDKKILFPNTNSGYGVGEDGIHCTEESPLNPISIYGKTKVDAERYIQEHTDGICFRLATVFGVSPRMRTDLLVNDFVYKAITDKYIVVFEHNFKRNFIHVRDVASVFLFMIQNYENHKGQVFNVGLSDANLSKKELLEKIQKYVKNFAVVYDDYYEDPDKRDYIVSNEKVESTGWFPQVDVDSGISELIHGYKMIVPRMGAEFRNGFPLGYANNT
jgi:nucleoside-diphosphate-sugar epimerase